MIMKKLVLFAVIMIAVSVCAPTRLINTATHKKMAVSSPVAAVFADLSVSEKKISYFMMPSKTVSNGGFDNVVNTAVREALLANGDADVLVGLETQVKYDNKGQVESITVSGYPAKYVNFRNPGDEYLKSMPAASDDKKGLPIGKIKLGK